MKRAVTIAAIVVLIGGAAGNTFRFTSVQPTETVSFAEIPMVAGPFTGAEHYFDSVSYEILKADTSTLRYYTDAEGRGYWLFVAYFASQKYGSQIHSPKHCLPGSGWRIDSNQPYKLSLPGGTTREANRLVISDGTARQLMFYWFETRGGAIRSEFGLKFDLVKNALTFQPTDAAIIRLTVPMETNDTIDSATQRVIRFFSVVYPDIGRALPFGT
jgi:EpsI family protein